MVFCYKIITESPRRSVCHSPERRSPVRQLASSISQLVGSVDYEAPDEILDCIPEKEWRLLEVLAKKREESEERERLADRFRRMWQKEKTEREIAAAETLEQYQRFLRRRREDERVWQEFRRLQRTVEQQCRTGRLVACIQHKEKRSADALACQDDLKTNVLMDRAIVEECRALLAADKRNRMGEAEQWKRQLELMGTQKRADAARRRRNAMLKDASQRASIINALNSWETCLIRQEVLALDEAKRASHAARAALTDARCIHLARARESRIRRARRLAVVTSQLRDAVRGRKS